MKMFKKIRSLKVYEKLVRFGDPRFRAKYKTIPSIVLQGEWLRELGFEAGDRIRVECSEGKISIQREEAAVVDPERGVAA